MIFAEIPVGEVMKVLMLLVAAAVILGMVADEFVDIFKKLKDVAIEKEQAKLEQMKIRNQIEQERAERKGKSRKKEEGS